MNFPNEILDKIIKILKEEINNNQLYQCMQVNKQWNTLVQPILFEKVLIDINKPEIISKMILNSKRNPGKWVKYLEFKGNLFSNNVLYSIMMCCPNVLKVNCITNMDWEAFFNVLSTNDNWQIKSIPALLGFRSDEIYFYGLYYYEKCCIHLCKSLSELDFSHMRFFIYLEKFTQLRKLHIRRSTLMHFSKAIEMINNHLSQVVELEISFNELINQHFSYEQFLNAWYRFENNHVCTNVKILTLKDYPPFWKKKQDLNMLKNFQHLDILIISFSKPVQPDLIYVFLLWVSTIPTYRIQFKVDDEDSSLMKTIYCLKEFTRDTLTIDFTPFAYDPPQAKLNTRVIIYNSTPFGKMNVTLIFCMKQNQIGQVCKAKMIRSDAHHYFDKVEMKNYGYYLV